MTVLTLDASHSPVASVTLGGDTALLKSPGGVAGVRLGIVAETAAAP